MELESVDLTDYADRIKTGGEVTSTLADWMGVKNQAAFDVLNDPETTEYVEVTSLDDNEPRYLIGQTARQKREAKARELYVQGEIDYDEYVALVDAIHDLG